MAAKTTDNLLEICPLCSESITIYAIGKCDHPVCFKCSTRMRVLCEQVYCAICRTDMPKVIFCKKSHKFDSIHTHGYPSYRRHLYFETDTIQSAFYNLQEHNCSLCSGLRPFRTFVALKTHMKKEHNVFYCDLCVEHLKVFTFERKTYDRRKLAEHRRIGDVDDRSQSHKGHPLCEFCEQRYLDNDELARHLRKQHYICHFCESDGISNQFYDVYPDLRVHFQTNHYLCEEGECAELEFTNAFRSEIDMKAHTSQMHGRGMSKAAARQARTIDINIQYSDSPSNRRQDHRGPRDGPREKRPGYNSTNRARGRRDRDKEREEEEQAKVMSALLNTDIARQGNINVVDKVLLQGSLRPNPEESKAAAFEERTADFPTLDGRMADRSSDEEERSGDGSSRPDTLAKRLARANKFSVQDGDMEDQDFPTLGGKPVKPNWPSPSSGWDFHGAPDDFPSLGHSASKKKPAQPGSWVPPKPEPSFSARSRTSVNSLSDFPSLSSIGGSLVKPPAARPQPQLAAQSQTRTATARPANRTAPSNSRGSARPAPQTAPSNSRGPAQSNKREWMEGRDVSDVTTNVLLQNSVQGPDPKIRTITKVPDSSQPVPQSGNKKLTMADFPSLHGKNANKDHPSLSKKAAQPPATPATAWAAKKAEPQEDTVSEEKPEASQFLKMKTKNKKKKSKGAMLSQGNDWDSTSPHWSDADSGSRDSDLGAKIQPETASAAPAPVTEPAVQKPQPPTDKTKEKKPKSKKSKQPKDKKEKTRTLESERVEKAETLAKPSQQKKDSKKTVETAKEKSPSVSKSKDNLEVRLDAQLPKDSLSVAMTTPAEVPLVASSMNVEKKPEVVVPRHIPVTTEVTDFFPSFSEEAPSLLALKDKSNVPALDADDFPALGSAPSSKPAPPPPPGFSTGGARPPPGFTSQWNSNANKSAPPPGFAKSSAAAVPESTPNVSNAENVAPPASNGFAASYSYIQPSNFQQRNRDLISDIHALLGNSDDKFLQFKLSSGEFRQGNITAAEYYNKCSEVIGQEQFEKIFAELLVLLPDIGKQQQLLAAHSTQAKKATDGNVVKIGKGRKAGWGKATGTTDNFSSCATCQQVVSVSDSTTHQGQHSTSADFPSLGSSAAAGIVGMGSWGIRK